MVKEKLKEKGDVVGYVSTDIPCISLEKARMLGDLIIEKVNISVSGFNEKNTLMQFNKVLARLEKSNTKQIEAEPRGRIDYAY